MSQEPYYPGWPSGEERGRKEGQGESGGVTSRRQIYALVGLFMISVLVIGVVLALLSSGVGQSGGNGAWWQKVSISTTPITSSSLGTDITVTATVLGTPKNVTLNYLIIPNNATYSIIRTVAPKIVYMLLLSSGGTQYSYTIEGTEVLGDVTYYISAMDAYGNSATTPQYKIAVDDFNVVTSLKEMTVYVSSPASTTVYVNSLNNWAAPVSLRAVVLGLTALPGGLEADFNPQTVTPPKGGTATATMTVRATSTQFVPGGVYYMNVQGVANTQRGSFMRNGTVTELKVPDFNFTVYPQSQSVVRQVVNQIVEQITPFNLTINIGTGFEGPLQFRTSGLPTTGLFIRWLNANSTIHTVGTTIVTLQIVTDTTVNTGTYTLTIYVKAGGLEKWQQVSFNVLASQQS